MFVTQKCRNCKLDIPRGAKVCTHCGAKQGMGCGTAILIFLILGLFVFFVSSSGSKNGDDKTSTSQHSSTSSTTTTTSTPSVTDSSESKSEEESDYPVINGFVVGDNKGTIENSTATVVGVVGNATGRDCEYVSITIGFYSEGGVKVTSGIDNVLNLGEGEIWQYTVYGFGDNIANYKIEEITWY